MVINRIGMAMAIIAIINIGIRLFLEYKVDAESGFIFVLNGVLFVLIILLIELLNKERKER